MNERPVDVDVEVIRALACSCSQLDRHHRAARSQPHTHKLSVSLANADHVDVIVPATGAYSSCARFYALPPSLAHRYLVSGSLARCGCIDRLCVAMGLHIERAIGRVVAYRDPRCPRDGRSHVRCIKLASEPPRPTWLTAARRAVYKLCVAFPHPFSEKLYKAIRKFFRAYVNNVLKVPSDSLRLCGRPCSFF